MEDKPMLMSLTATYSQESCSNQNPNESLDITLEFVPGGGHYYILKTEQWSIDNPDELGNLTKALDKFADENYHLGAKTN